MIFRRGTISRLTGSRRVTFVALIVAMFFGLELLTKTTTAVQEEIRTRGSWLDRPLANWNKNLSELPPPASQADREIQARCPNLIRQPDTLYERRMVSAGWMLYGGIQSYGLTQVVTALSGADGMCHPMGHQAFVFVDNNYAGTLSPVEMDSRTNGDLTTIRFPGATSISAEFVRCRGGESLCIPTRISYVTYEVSGNQAPVVTPVAIVTKPLCSATSVSESSAESARLYEVKWRLVEINGIALTTNNPYIKFEGAAKIYAGNGGCNQIAGAFEISGTSISFSRAITTRMACLDAETEQVEIDFIKALEHTTRFQLQDNVLRFYDCETLLLVFKPDAGDVPSLTAAILRGARDRQTAGQSEANPRRESH